MPNINLTEAKRAKNDEFYTQYHDIEKEINAYIDYDPDVFRGKTILLPCDDPEWSNFTKYFAQNFERFGIKKLISTSYASASKKYKDGYQPTWFETTDSQYDEDKTTILGKIFTLDHDKTGDGKIDIEDLDWHYLQRDGDFRSKEVKKLRDEADIIITNPPFSLFREFLAWIVQADKDFLIIGNMNAITYKEVFPLIKENKMWFGPSISSGDREFQVPDNYPINAAGWRIDEEGRKFLRIKGVRWFTNIDHGRRHQPLPLMSMKENLKFNKKLRGKTSYVHYDNYDAIEIPFTNAIPSDYDDIMGVPISFLDKYCPEQFEIVWQASGNTRASAPKKILKRLNYRSHSEDRGGCTIVNGKRTYGRILIKHRK
ncbi:MAG TPA: DNA methyltransferase [Candidatus Cloacimonetes bacterium]|nr:DNA methyltransferase [Candidatus Cloacimonadota bacterium]